jgi:hypothetical protein
VEDLPVIPENILVTQNSYRLHPHPFGSRKYESLFTKKTNYSEVAFKPGILLQAAELNEIQENFFLKSSLRTMFYSSWPIYSSPSPSPEIVEELVGGNDVPYLFPSLFEAERAYPLRSKNQITFEVGNTIIIKFGIGWYHVPLVTNAGTIKSHWFYLFTPQTLEISKDITEQSFYIGFDITFLQCTHEEKDANNNPNEGYFLNDRSNRFINPNTDGADRIKLSITSFTTTPGFGSMFIGKVVKLDNKYILRGANNYMMQMFTNE